MPSTASSSSHSSSARPPRRALRRSRWRWFRRIVGTLLAAVLGLFLVNYFRALYGDARDMTLVDVWRGVNFDSLTAVAAVAADSAPVPAAPLLDSIARGYIEQVNDHFPRLIVWHQVRPSGDLVVALNPAVYQTFQRPDDLGEWASELVTLWRGTLATAGALWPAEGQFEPGLVIVRLMPSGDGMELMADFRDGHALIADYQAPGNDSLASAVSGQTARPAAASPSAMVP